MGIFNFSKYNDIEKALLNYYSQMISTMSMSSVKAKKMTGDMLDQSIEESKKEGTYYLPQNLGDIILGDAGSDNLTIKQVVESIRQKLPKRKAEGVRDEDIKWWWNLNDVERRIMLKQDEKFKISLYLAELADGKTFEEATSIVKKFHPIFGDPDDTTHTTGDDRPLPYELKDRINIYTEKIARGRGNLEKYKNEIEQSSTFNALIRKEIKAGNL